MVHKARAYPGFFSKKRLGVFLLLAARDSSPSQGYPLALNSQYPVIHLGGQRHCHKSLLFYSRTQHSDSGQGSNQTAWARVKPTGKHSFTPKSSLIPRAFPLRLTERGKTQWNTTYTTVFIEHGFTPLCCLHCTRTNLPSKRKNPLLTFTCKASKQNCNFGEANVFAWKIILYLEASRKG